MRKKILGILMVAMVVSLVGCAKSNTDKNINKVVKIEDSVDKEDDNNQSLNIDADKNEGDESSKAEETQSNTTPQVVADNKVETPKTEKPKAETPKKTETSTPTKPPTVESKPTTEPKKEEPVNTGQAPAPQEPVKTEPVKPAPEEPTPVEPKPTAPVETKPVEPAPTEPVSPPTNNDRRALIKRTPSMEDETLKYINELRQSLGLNPMQKLDILTNSARYKSDDMLVYNYFEHTGLDGSKPWDVVGRFGYNPRGLGENIYYTKYSGYTKGAYDIYKGWFNSPGHYALMVSPEFTKAAVGISEIQEDGSTIRYATLHVSYE